MEPLGRRDHRGRSGLAGWGMWCKLLDHLFPFQKGRDRAPEFRGGRDPASRLREVGSWGPLSPEQPRLCGPGFVGGEEGVSFLSLGHQGMTTPHIWINGNLQGTGRTSPPYF